MTRDELVTELQVRGWSRFTATQLQKYLDWALQDLYGMAHYPRSTVNVAAIVGSSDVLTFDQIAGGTTGEGVHQIKTVQAHYMDNVIPVDPATEVQFSEIMWPNNNVVSKLKASYPQLYYVYDRKVYLYPAPRSSIEMFVHFLKREDVFSGGTDLSGLPERFDKAIIAQCEAICCRRAHDTEGYAFAQSAVREFLLDELGLEGEQMEEQYDRIVPWRG